MPQADSGSGQSPFPGSKTSVISQCPLMAEEVRELNRVPFTRALMLS